MSRHSARLADTDTSLHGIVKQLTMHRSTTTPDRALVRQFADILATPGVDVNRLVPGSIYRHTLFGELVALHVKPYCRPSSPLTECAHLLAKHAGTDVNNCTTSKYQGQQNPPVLDTLIRYCQDKKKVDPLVQRILTAIIAHPELIVTASQILDTILRNFEDDTILSLIDHPSMAHATIQSLVLTEAVFRGRDRVVRRLLRHPGVRINERVSTYRMTTPLQTAMWLHEWYGTKVARLRILRALVEHDQCAVQELRPMAGANICEEIYKILLKSERFDMHNIRIHN